jgi:hypothetical protein
VTVEAIRVCATEVNKMPGSSAPPEDCGDGPVDHLVLALQRSRIIRALHAMRDCHDRLDISGALDAEKNLNENLDLLCRLLHRRGVASPPGLA